MNSITKNIHLLNSLTSLKLFKKPVPFSGVFWITENCNCRCKMCSIWSSESKKEMDLNTFIKAFRQSKLLRRLILVVFTGGEPFLKDDLPDFVEIVNRYSSPLNISFGTNGLFTDRIISSLDKILSKNGAPINVKLSLDGIGEVDDTIRGIKGCFNKSVETLVRMQEFKLKYPKKFSISLGFTATSLNYQQMPRIIDLAKEYGVDYFYKPIMYAEALLNEGIDNSLFLTSDQLKFLTKYHWVIVASTNKGGFAKKYLYTKYLNFLTKYYKKPKRYFPCYAALASFHVSSDWNVFSCLKYAYVLGNLKENTFDDIFNGGKAISLREKIKKSDCSCLCTGEIFPAIIVNGFPLFI